MCAIGKTLICPPLPDTRRASRSALWRVMPTGSRWPRIRHRCGERRMILLRSHPARCRSPIHEEHLTVDVIRGCRGQEEDGAVEILNLADAAAGMLRQDLPCEIRVLEQ